MSRQYATSVGYANEGSSARQFAVAGAFANEASAGSAPAAPSGLAVASVTASGVNLTWTDNATDETGFTLEYDTSSGFSNPTDIDIPTGNTQSDSVLSLAADTTYYFRVRAYNGSGNSAWSNTASGTTEAAAASAHRRRRMLVLSRGAARRIFRRRR